MRTRISAIAYALPFLSGITHSSDNPNIQRIEAPEYIRLESKTYVTNSLKLMMKEIGSVSKYDLVLISLDGNMISSPRKIALAEDNSKLWEDTQDEFHNEYPQNVKDNKQAQEQIITTIEDQVLDCEWCECISEINDGAGKLLAITRMENVQSTNEMKIEIILQRLKELGIDLADKFLRPPLELNSENNLSPYYKDGLIMSSPLSKPAALDNFFELTDYSPKRIIYLTAEMEDIQGMQRMCHERGIGCVVIWYKPMETSKPNF